MSIPTATRHRPRWAFGVLGLYLLAMALVVGYPDGWAINRIVVDLYYRGVGLGLPSAFGPSQWELLLNVLICLPPVAAAVVLVPRVPWWMWVVVGGLLSVAVETAQSFIGRFADPVDVVANTSGALLGALVGRWMLLRRGAGRSG